MPTLEHKNSIAPYSPSAMSAKNKFWPSFEYPTNRLWHYRVGKWPGSWRTLTRTIKASLHHQNLGVASVHVQNLHELLSRASVPALSARRQDYFFLPFCQITVIGLTGRYGELIHTRQISMPLKRSLHFVRRRGDVRRDKYCSFPLTWGSTHPPPYRGTVPPLGW